MEGTLSLIPLDKLTAPGGKPLGDLDDLVQAVLKALPTTKPWQRQLRDYLRAADRQIQVLRLTLSLRRSREEVVEAEEALLRSLRAAQGYVNGGRADMGTRTAVLLASELMQKVARELEQ
ncbi:MULTISPECIES: hypothetical protein [unclassified Roseateles]|uniref:hypothetical protein n=1 Tax=unclassified Roseateles TaxID=2626991 RepID=UPI0006F37997|nr:MULTISPECIES: hypothetical protein [unclassified Roseateles]KQW43312.1 hypothetical protein ASC81_16080 [Pelomonas sp. Root405]KRA71050.1 hypothetical protein ASD88_14605 [Pelomonas sp. Root662]